jgi:hypothetical protein
MRAILRFFVDPHQPSEARIAGGLTLAHSASCGLIINPDQARECERHNCDLGATPLNKSYASPLGLGSDCWVLPTACAVG